MKMLFFVVLLTQLITGTAESTHDSHLRTKRAVLNSVEQTGCKTFCHPKVRDDVPPEVTCPSFSTPVITDEGQNTAIVTWDDATATDNVEVKSITQIHPDLGSKTFKEGPHILIYLAKDTSENIDTCKFKFSVKVPRCTYPSSPSNGRASCPKCPPRYGDVCSFTCNLGYTPSQLNKSNQKCLQNGYLEEDGRFTCEPISCGIPSLPSNAKRGSCSNEYKYNSVCDITCRTGFNCYGQTTGQIRCLSSGNWSTSSFYCSVNSCGTPSLPANVDIHSCTNSYNFQSLCTLKCKPGFQHPSGSTGHTQCQADDTWSKISFYCSGLTCTPPENPSNGKVSCPNIPPRLADTCTFTCDTGYITDGKYQTKKACLQSGNLEEDGKFVCNAISCNRPSLPMNAELNASQDCSSEYRYSSVCQLRCQSGYFPTGGMSNMSRITCRSDGTWTVISFSCSDASPPEIRNCPSSFIAYVGKNQQTAYVDYEVPVAYDKTDGNVKITRVQGIAPKTSVMINRKNLDNNKYTVEYTATDSHGFKAKIPCIFCIHIEELDCPILDDKDKLVKTCTNPLTYGAKCSFSCESMYPIEGPKEVYCERSNTTPPVGYWDWGNSNSTYCKVPQCLPLSPPKNGAMACTSLSFGLYCQMACNENYDIPITDNTKGEYVCDEKKDGWVTVSGPLHIPDCSRRRLTNQTSLPSEFHYFSGNCTSQATMDEIKGNVIKNLNDSNNIWKSYCTTISGCSFDNVRVSCGELTGRRKRTAIMPNFVIVRFDISFAVNPAGQNIQQLYHKVENESIAVFNKINDGIKGGSMDIPGYKADKSSLTYDKVKLSCDEGMEERISSFSCVGCPTGSMYDTTNKKCTLCPVGMYQIMDAKKYCNSCPSLYSTKSIGSKSENDCISLCSPGYISKDGLGPCEPCGRNTYQDEHGKKECTPCPRQTNTSTKAATSLLNCTSDADVCKGILCNGKGTCWPYGGTFKCSCTDGYTGTLCTTPPDPCMENICVNDFTCERNGPNYKCNCSENYSGTRCQDKKVHGGWSMWGQFSPCSVTCATGVRTRSRVCNNPSPSHGGNNCIGDTTHTATCDTKEECPVDGGWGSWGPFTDCSTTCQEGSRTRTRQCDNPRPRNSGKICSGNNTDTGICNSNISCPVNGGWSHWGEFTECSTTCGAGTRVRLRVCNTPPPNHGGLNCSGNATESVSCDTGQCPSCKQFRRPYGVNVIYSGDAKALNASLLCVKGKILNPSHPKVLTCSEETSYEWNPKLDNEELPKCVVTTAPEKMSLQTNYSIKANDKNGGELTSASNTAAVALADTSDCVRNKKCKSEVNSVLIRGQPSQGSESLTVETTLIVSVDFNYDDYFINGVLEEKKAASVLDDYFSYLNDLEQLAGTIKTKADDGALSVVLNGATYTADASSLTQYGSLTCASGMNMLSGVCANCAPGTYETNGNCKQCPVGSFQDQEGKTTCTECPPGFVTLRTGSLDAASCGIVSTDLSTADSTTAVKETIATKKTIEEGSSSTVIIISVIIVLVVALIAAGVMVYIVVRLVKRRKTPPVESKENETNNGIEALRGYERKIKEKNNDGPNTRGGGYEQKINENNNDGPNTRGGGYERKINENNNDGPNTRGGGYERKIDEKNSDGPTTREGKTPPVESKENELNNGIEASRGYERKIDENNSDGPTTHGGGYERKINENNNDGPNTRGGGYERKIDENNSDGPTTREGKTPPVESKENELNNGIEASRGYERKIDENNSDGPTTRGGGYERKINESNNDGPNTRGGGYERKIDEKNSDGPTTREGKTPPVESKENELNNGIEASRGYERKIDENNSDGPTTRGGKTPPVESKENEMNNGIEASRGYVQRRHKQNYLPNTPGGTADRKDRKNDRPRSKSESQIIDSQILDKVKDPKTPMNTPDNVDVGVSSDTQFSNNMNNRQSKECIYMSLDPKTREDPGGPRNSFSSYV